MSNSFSSARLLLPLGKSLIDAQCRSIRVCPSVCMFVRLSTRTSVCLPDSACVSLCAFFYQTLHVACLSISPSGCVCLSLCVSVCLPGFAYLSVWQHVHVFLFGLLLSVCPAWVEGCNLEVWDMDGSSHCGLIMVPSQEAFGDNLGIFFYFLHNNYMLSILIHDKIRKFP